MRPILSERKDHRCKNRPAAWQARALFFTKQKQVRFLMKRRIQNTCCSSGKYIVEISFQGYTSILETVNITDNPVKNFALKETYIENEAVIVTGVASATKVRQSAQPVSIVKKSELLQTSSTNVIDALSKLVPGVSGLSTGPAISKPVIRGLGYNRVVTVHDGVRQEGQQWGDEHGIEIDEYSIQKIEVLKGPGFFILWKRCNGGCGAHHNQCTC
jgi:outer membrane receptor for monomeric catechols